MDDLRRRWPFGLKGEFEVGDDPVESDVDDGTYILTTSGVGKSSGFDTLLLLFYVGEGSLFRKHKRFSQNKSGLEIRCRAERKTFLAVAALLRGYFRNETNLPSGSTVDITDSMFLLDLSTVSDTETAEDTKRGFFFETVFVCSILLSQIQQLG